MTKRWPQAAGVSIDDFVDADNLQASDLALVGLVLLVTWIAGRIARRAVLRVLAGVSGFDENLRQLAGRFTRYVVWLVGFGIALSFLGAAVQPVLAAVLLIAVIAGLALRGIAENLAAGVVLQTRRPVQLGDEIEVLDHVGSVIDLNGRSVVLHTRDGQRVHLPNNLVLQNPIINNSAMAKRRSDIEIRAASADVNQTMRLIESTIAATAGVAAEPAPVVRLTGAHDGRRTYRIRVWHEPKADVRVTSAVIGDVAAAFELAGVEAAVVAPPPPPPLTPSPTL